MLLSRSKSSGTSAKPCDRHILFPTLVFSNSDISLVTRVFSYLTMYSMFPYCVYVLYFLIEVMYRKGEGKMSKALGHLREYTEDH